MLWFIQWDSKISVLNKKEKKSRGDSFHCMVLCEMAEVKGSLNHYRPSELMDSSRWQGRHPHCTRVTMQAVLRVSVRPSLMFASPFRSFLVSTPLLSSDTLVLQIHCQSLFSWNQSWFNNRLLNFIVFKSLLFFVLSFCFLGVCTRKHLSRSIWVLEWTLLWNQYIKRTWNQGLHTSNSDKCFSHFYYTTQPCDWLIFSTIHLQ